jgi:putative peptidoglycan lipid II flippase
VLGYVRDAVLANVFGAGVAFDAFIAAQTIPNVLRRLVAEGTLMLAYVPLLAGEQARGGLPAMRRFAGAVVGLLLPVLLVLVAAGAFFPSVLVDLFASGFDAPRAELAARLTRVMMPFLFFISLVAVAAGTLNTVGVFGPPAAAPILLNACIIGAVLLARGRFEPPISAAAWGVALGGLAQLALQLPFLARARLLVAPRLEPGHPSIRRLARRMLPALFGVGVYQLNMVIIRQLASYLPRGQLSCYFYASRLEEFALGVFAVSISVAALPTLSEHAARGDASALFRTFRRAARATTFVTVPAMAGLWVLAEPIVGTLFRHGQFDATAAHLTADLVTILALALVPIGAVRIMVPTYYAVGDTRTPVIAATASMITTGLAGAVLGHRFEIHGLTAATVIAATVQVVLLGLWLPGKVRAAVGAGAAPRADPSVLGHAIRAVAAVVPGAVLAGWGARERTWVGGDNLENAIVLGVLGGLMVASYAGLARLLGLAEVALILAAVRRRLPARFRG